RIGEWVLAVGNPFNLTSTVTAGIVSAKGRNINILDFDPNREIFPVESFIQTDAAVNPGNSGGALVNTRGELIGINTAIASRTGSYSGYSFAVPSSIVQKVTHDLLEFGNVQRAYIGVSIAELNQELADRLGIEDVAGVYVRGLTEGGAAAIVGIREGDIIYMVAGKRVNHVPELQEHVSRYRPGDKLKVTVKRGNDLLEYDVTVTDRYGNTTVDTSARSANVRTKDAVFEVVGKQELERLNIAMGVRLSQDLNGRFSILIRNSGFIITRINKKTIEKPEDVVSLLEPKEGGVLIEGVYPNGTVAYYGFGM
ncbi:MAG: PDZ domain-containing protein, partial [Bacteroidetes bacterium]|nr:PDZ domain-containing protein [Bacteroidota bacterium]